MGTSAHRPCFDLSVCLQSVCLSPVCPSLFCRSDWLANPIACASFPHLTLLIVDSLDSKLWYRSGCRAAALASSSISAVGQSFGSFSPRGARSKGDQQPDGRVAHNSEAFKTSLGSIYGFSPRGSCAQGRLVNDEGGVEGAKVALSCGIFQLSSSSKPGAGKQPMI